MRALPAIRPTVARVEMTEKALLQAVFAMARDFGWEAYHPLISRWGASGWPDLTLVKPPRLIFAELKTGRNPVTQQQRKWLGLLRQCPGVEVYLWRPSDMQRIAEVLAHEHGGADHAEF
jgi:hypothetical protein